MDSRRIREGRPRSPTPPGTAVSAARRRRARALCTAGILLLGTLLAAGEAGGQSVPPDEEWRTLQTEHFRVTFPAHLEALGREAAARAERAHARLSDVLVDPPEGRTEILVTDHVDVANGSATPAPFPRIVVFAVPPVDGFALSHFDDWLETVLVHELAHVFHLDVTGPVGDVLRTVFGRVPAPWPFFPNLGVPRWTIEGLATWYESALTESGRVRGSYHEMVLRTASLEERFESIDQASGASPVWPGGERPYIYGSLFFDHLLERYGEEKMEAFVEAVGDQLVPYRLDAAARDAFGVSFSEAWRAWQREVAERSSALRTELAGRAPVTEPIPLTRDAREALFARLDPEGGTLVFARADGRSDTQLRAAEPDGSGARKLTRTNGPATFDFTPDGGVLFAQLEWLDPYRLYSDLWLLDPGGDVRRLTRGRRLDHPSVAPGGEDAVAIELGNGTTRLVEVALDDGDVRALTPERADVHWAYPAVSPDGRWIAAARWTPGAHFDIVVTDREGRVVAEVTSDRALDTHPAWSPDGRWLVWGSDRSGIPNILAAPFDPESGRAGPVRQLTNVLTGVGFPSVSPDGGWIYLSLYGAEGWDVARVPFDPGAAFEPAPLDERFRAGEGAAEEVAHVEPAPGEVEAYDPLPTLRPRFWEPAFLPAVSTRGFDVIDPSVGFSTRAADLVGRHALSARILASISDFDLSGAAGYQWSGLGNPVFSVGGSQFWDAAGPFSVEVDGERRTLFLEERNRSASLQTTFRRARVRTGLSLTLAAGLFWERRSILEEDLSPSELELLRPESRLADLRATLGFSTARAFPFSIGLQEGVSVSLTGRRRSELDLPDSLAGRPGVERSVDEVFGQVRAYRGFSGPGFADHVVALRVSGAAATGPGADAFHYSVGGSSGGSEPFSGFGLFGSRFRFFPARGFDDGDRTGRYAWSASLEYRVPIALVNGGLGLLPIHLDRLAGSVFVDAANAWGPVEEGVSGFDNPRGDPLVSAGVEVVADLLSFFSIPLTLRGGVAFRVSEDGAPTGYVRFGRPF